MSCGISMIKYLLFIFNLLCALLGILFVVLGVLFLTKDDHITRVVDEIGIHPFTSGVIILGAVIFVIAFFGCCGAIRESQCLSIMYSICLFIIMIFNIALVVIIFMVKPEIPNYVQKAVQDLFNRRQQEPSVFDALQRSLHCCGVNGPLDWLPQKYPQSCCQNPDEYCILPVSRGCSSLVNDFIESNANIVTYAALGMLGVEILGFIFACILANHIRNRDRRAAY